MIRRAKTFSRGVRAGRRGFTLIEALAAITVVIIVIPVLLEGFNLAGAIAISSRQTSDATALAQSQLEELIATQQWQAGAASGEEIIGNIPYNWVASTDVWDNEPNVQQLTVTVSWQPCRGKRSEIALTSLVYQSQSTIQTTATPAVGRGSLP